MAGAYYFLDGPNCMVKTTPTMVFGGSSWCPDCPSEAKNYNVNSWNQLYPACKVPVPNHCSPPTPPAQPQPLPNGNSPLPGAPAPSQKPPQSESPAGPVTGPADDPCAPAMSERLGSQDRFGFDTAEHLTMPRTGVFYSVRTGKDHVGASSEPGYTGKPLETRPARVTKRGGMITVAEPGSGDGFVVFAPDDINEFGLRGDGVHPDGKWPRKIAMNTFVIMNSKAANGGDDVRNRFAVGTPSARTRGVVVRGVDIDLDFTNDPDNPDTNFTARDETGATGTGRFVFNGGDLIVNGLIVGSTEIDPTGGVQVADGEIGLGSLKPDVAGIVKGWRFKLDFSRLSDPDNPDLYLNQIDEEGATSTTGKFYINGTEVTTGGIGGSTGSTDNAILRADGTGGSTVQASGLLVSDVTGGVVSVRTPDSTLSYSNGITIKTGDTTSADDTGAVVVDAGAPSGGTAGGISIGTANASAVTLGRSGQTIVANTNLVMPKTSGVGIKVDTASPTFGWRDLLGEIQIRGTGGTDPTYLTYNSSGIRAFFFAVNDEVFLAFHIPHDYVPGSDIHLHFHWSQDEKTTAGAGTNPVTGGSVTWGYEIMYAKGHQQAAFGASVSGTVLQSASTTKNHHHIAEVQVSAASPSASQIDSDNLEPDGVILCRAYLSANGMTVSSGNVPAPVLHYCDVHYQSTGMATKNKAPNFYS